MREELASPPPPRLRAELAHTATLARAAAGDDAFAAAWAAGRALPLEAAVAEALAPPPAAGGGPATASHGLTPRELDILRLIAEGRSNREIADILFLSERTVTTHITSILGKLGVSSRTSAAAAARRLGLV